MVLSRGETDVTTVRFRWYVTDLRTVSAQSKHAVLNLRR